MSGNESESSQGGAGRREVAWRLFAAEYDDADFDYSESDEERAPNYVVTPTGARVNRLFVVGVLTEVEQVSDEVLRGRVVDPTGAFVLYAGQYQPDEMAFLESADPPMFVAVTGKARTFQPDDSDRVFTSIRPESINEVDADTRDRWVVQTAEQTLDRASTFADALDAGQRGDDLRAALEARGVDAGLASGVPLAIEHYATTKSYLAAVRDLALDSARVVAGESDADDVGPLDLAPDEGGDAVDAAFDYSLTQADEAEPDTDESAADTDESAAGSESATSDDLGEAPAPSVDESAPEPAETADPETEATTESGEASGTEPGEPPEAVPETEVGAETDEVPEVTDADDAAELQEEVGTDEPPTVESEGDASTDETPEPEGDASTDETPEPETATEDDGPDLGTAGAGDEMYEFDEEEREQVEAEYGLEFSSGTDVDSPEESDLEPPETEVEGEPGDADEAPAGGETAAAEAPGASVGDDEMAEGGDAETDEKPVPDSLENAVMERMDELADDDGVERETLVAAVVQSYDVTPADVEDALESALMAGRCYEAGEDTLKPI